ncbi:MAG TPA: hypothetical protein VMV10_31885, partial [Pirellulales bacterium]|nr:hypothetical protein [Pirellulales bacterium]
WPFPKHRETSAMKHPPQGETITLDWSNHIRERPPWRSVNPVFTVYPASRNATEGVPYRESPLHSVKWYHYLRSPRFAFSTAFSYNGNRVASLPSVCRASASRRNV